MKLNPIAALAVNYINTSNRHVFLTGKAGTGKTTLLKYIVDNTHKNVVVTAPTGIAAINAGGTTLHSLLQLPFGTFIPVDQLATQQYQQLNTPKSVLSSLRFNKKKLNLLREIELLIIDEVSMLRADLLDCADLILRHVRRKRNQPFGGLQILFIGDLNQLPPVVKNGEWPHLAPHYKSIYFFEALGLQQEKPVQIELEKIYRQEDQAFIDILNNLRNNKLLAHDNEVLNQRYREDALKNIQNGYIHITTHNHKADEINREELVKLKSKIKNFEASIEGDFPENLYPISEKLSFKEGAQVMFIKNDPTGEQKFFNGKIGKITDIGSSYIKVTGDDDGITINVDKYAWENTRFELNEATNEVEEKTIGVFEQYPLRLAWAITVHKSQGLTFKKAILDLSASFAPGQIYVALSRLTSLNGLILSSKLPDTQFSKNQAVQAYNDNKKPYESLKKDLEDDRKKYVFDFCKKVYDFSSLLTVLNGYNATFDKDEQKSAKQKYKSFHVQLLEEFKPIKAVADKFILQVSQIEGSDDSNLETLKARMSKAEAYFKPLIDGIIAKFEEHRNKVKTQKSVKSYLKELRELVSSFYKHDILTNKASLLLESALSNSALTKETLKSSAIYQKRTAALADQEKEIKIPTKDISFNFFKEGLTIEEIAEKREMVPGTIEGHLSHFIGTGEIDIFALIRKEKVANIIKAIEEVKEGGSSEVKTLLGDDYSYGEIKMVRAHLDLKK